MDNCKDINFYLIGQVRAKAEEIKYILRYSNIERAIKLIEDIIRITTIEGSEDL